MTNGEGTVRDLYYGNDSPPLFTPPLFKHLNYQKFLNSYQKCSMLDLSVQSDGVKMFYLSSAFPTGRST